MKEDGSKRTGEQFASSTNDDKAKEIESTERVYLGKTKDGADVYDRKDSHFHGEGGLTLDLLSMALGAIDTKGSNFIKEQVDFDRQIGYRTCVEVGPDDDIVMAYRKTKTGSREGLTPMVKNREAEPSNSVTAILSKNNTTENSSYTLITAYIGEDSPREPWDPHIDSREEREKSENFWRTHALIYDDSLIDWEKTKGFEFMSPAMKERELIRPKVVYSGIFINPHELYDIIQPTLEKPIRSPHVTTAFKPKLPQLNIDQLGSEAKIVAIGYGNNGKNEGLLVRVESDDPVVQEACDAIKTPHITLSVSKGGQAKHTADLEFTPLKEPFEITGRYGFYAQGSPVFKRDDLTPKNE